MTRTVLLSTARGPEERDNGDGLSRWQNITTGQTAHGHSPVFRIVGRLGAKVRGDGDRVHRAQRSGGLRSPTGHRGTPGISFKRGPNTKTKETSRILGAVFKLQRMRNRIKQILQTREAALPMHPPATRQSRAESVTAQHHASASIYKR